MDDIRVLSTTIFGCLMWSGRLTVVESRKVLSKLDSAKINKGLPTSAGMRPAERPWPGRLVRVGVHHSEATRGMYCNEYLRTSLRLIDLVGTGKSFGIIDNSNCFDFACFL